VCRPGPESETGDLKKMAPALNKPAFMSVCITNKEIIEEY
jgi:hypothetical protein